MTSDPTRIAPLSPALWSGDMVAAIDPLRPKTPRPEGSPKGLNVLGTFAHYPALAKAFLAFNAHVLYESTLTPRQRELIILRVAAVRNCDYEWAQHAVIAGESDIDKAEIERVRTGPDAPEWSTVERAMLLAVDELLRDATMTDETFAVLSSQIDERQLLDLIFTVGAYDVTAMLLRVCGTPLDDDLPA